VSEPARIALRLLGLLLFLLGLAMLLGGGVLALVMRPSDKGPVTIDLSGRRGS
jgi:hypothetical protein